jgi:hypothetical protein
MNEHNPLWKEFKKMDGLIERVDNLLDQNRKRKKQPMDQTLYLTRLKNKGQKNPSDDLLPLDNSKSGQLSFNQISWAQPYHHSRNEPAGTLILLNSGEFRTYTQSFDYVKQKVEQIVGQMMMNKKAVPTMPWWNT